MGPMMMSGTYDYWLVALSFGISVVTAYTAIAMVERVTSYAGAQRYVWLGGGALSVGTGIWCMHYIGMLAFRLSIPVRYHWPTVALSLLISMLASLVLLFAVSRQRTGGWTPYLGSAVAGGGIACMHYVGMAAMRMQATCAYNPWLVFASIALAMLMALAALKVLTYMGKGNRGLWLKLLVALILGLTIPVMHYTAMAAATFVPSHYPLDYANSIQITTLANFAILRLTMLILGIAAVTSVVDRRISGQAKLLDDERKMMRALIDNIPDHMYVKDIEGRFILVNSEVAKRFGLSDPQSVIGKTDFDFYPFELAAAFREDELRVMSGGKALIQKEEMGMDPEGNTIPMLTTKVPLRDRTGRVNGIAGVGRDITWLKNSEAALVAAEQKYRRMFDEALVGIFNIEADGSLIQVNPAMAHSMGYESPEEMYALLPDGLFTTAVSQASHEEILQQVIADGFVKSFELEIYRKDGEKIWISSSMRAKHEESRVVGYAGIFEDITERRALRDQLLQAQKLESVGQLAAGIAHEINTPVQYIGDNVRFLRDTFDELIDLNRTYSRLLESARGGAVSEEVLCEVDAAIRKVDVDYVFEEIPKAIGQTLEGVSRVAGLVGAMKEFSHPGTGKKVLLDLNRAIHSTVTVTRNEWKYVAEMDLNLEEALPMVSCLPGEFNQVILNMIINASHAIADVSSGGSAAKGLISIQTRSLDNVVEIRIQDTGGGIPEEIRTRIFDPFFTTKEIGKGTGQGLAIARSVVVDKHQGTIEVETESGRGATFIIRLPCEASRLLTEATVAA